jgi:hypothetical protein
VCAEPTMSIDSSHMSTTHITRAHPGTCPASLGPDAPDSCNFHLDSCVLSHINNLIVNRPATAYLYLTLHRSAGFARIVWQRADSLFVKGMLSNPW